MVKTALKNPYAVIVFALAIFVIGVTAISKLPTDILPTFKTPAVQVVTFYPGTPAEVMEKDITSRLERWTGQSNGIARQEAKSMIGVSVVKDFFREDVDPNTAMSQVTSLAMSDLYYLPPGTIPPMVMPFDPTASIPLCLISVSSPTFDETKLYDVAYFDLRNRLQSITGVIAPAVYGGRLRRILAYVDPFKAQARGLSSLDVINSIRDSNVMIPTGNAKFGVLDYQINANGMVPTVPELNDLPLRVGYGPPTYIRDVAKVEDSHQIQTNIVRVQGKRQVYIPIYRQPGANTIAVVEGIKAQLKPILERIKGINLDVVMDSIGLCAPGDPQSRERSDPWIFARRCDGLHFSAQLPAHIDRAGRFATRVSRRVHWIVFHKRNAQRHDAWRHRRGHRYADRRIDCRARKHGAAFA